MEAQGPHVRRQPCRSGRLLARELFHGEEFGRVVGSEGQAFVVHSDIDALEAELNGLSPAGSAPRPSTPASLASFTVF